ncbi:MAG: hypothetical protein KIS91_01575 [Anaerolineae bacterium]|nr:hypothetical protein [Anaerolineae bacterium]
MAADFPRLNIVIAHLGWPWVLDSVWRWPSSTLTSTWIRRRCTSTIRGTSSRSR